MQPYRILGNLPARGVHNALTENKHLLNGLNIYKGMLTRPEVAADLGLEFTEAEEAIKAIAG